MTIDLNRLKQVLDYNPLIGVFTWKTRTSNRTKIGGVAGYTRDGYVQIRVDGRLHYGHRLAFLFMSGRLPLNHVDHINGTRSDNRWENLREASPLENRRNAARNKNNTSGVTGVVWDATKQKWMARITVDHKDIFLGYFDDIPQAAACRKRAEHQHNFHTNHGRN